MRRALGTQQFVTIMMAFDHGYRRLGREDDWPMGLYRWAYVMGRRQSKGALEEQT